MTHTRTKTPYSPGSLSLHEIQERRKSAMDLALWLHKRCLEVSRAAHALRGREASLVANAVGLKTAYRLAVNPNPYEVGAARQSGAAGFNNRHARKALTRLVRGGVWRDK